MYLHARWYGIVRTICGSAHVILHMGASQSPVCLQHAFFFLHFVRPNARRGIFTSNRCLSDGWCHREVTQLQSNPTTYPPRRNNPRSRTRRRTEHTGYAPHQWDKGSVRTRFPAGKPCSLVVRVTKLLLRYRRLPESERGGGAGVHRFLVDCRR